MPRVFSNENPQQCPSGKTGAAPRESSGSAVLSWLLHGLLRAPRQCVALAHHLASPRGRHALAVELRAVSRGIAPAPTLLRAAVRNEFCLWYWVRLWAQRRPNQRAIIDESGHLTWRELCERAEALGAALAHRGLVAGSPVVLIAENSRFLVTALLAVHREGGCPVLLDPACDMQWVPFAMAQTRAAMVWVAREELVTLLPDSSIEQVFVGEALDRRSCDESRRSDAPQRESVGQNPKKRLALGRDTFAVLLTSGSTASPRLIPISNYRAVLSGYGMGHVCLGQHASDTIYCALPLSHATALLTGLCAALITGSAFALRTRFSGARFWSDIARFRATSALYVGEIARRLIAAPESDGERKHDLKVLYGTGMPLDVWHRIQSRFGIARIAEFYGATELPIAMINLSEAPGFMGRIALSEVSPWQVVRIDNETGLPLQADNGAFESCDADEPGELVFLGRHRTGDVVARDVHGYVRHLGRRPGVFRQAGLTTSSDALRTALLGVTGVRELGVTHVTLPRYDGHAGLVVLVPGDAFELRHLEGAYQRLPKQQRPRFLRLTDALQLNRGLKFDAEGYARAGVDPERVTDPLYVYAASGFEPINAGIWRELLLGTYRF